MLIPLVRDYKKSKEGTFGKMFVGDSVFATCERLDMNNQRNISCIPEGIYTLKKRVSAVVDRTSKGEYAEGWEVTNVPNRTYIMIHIGNFPTDVEGCIAVGSKFMEINGRDAVYQSAISFDKFMKLLDSEEEHTLVIGHN